MKINCPHCEGAYHYDEDSNCFDSNLPVDAMVEAHSTVTGDLEILVCPCGSTVGIICNDTIRCRLFTEHADY